MRLRTVLGVTLIGAVVGGVILFVRPRPVSGVPAARFSSSNASPNGAVSVVGKQLGGDVPQTESEQPDRLHPGARRVFDSMRVRLSSFNNPHLTPEETELLARDYAEIQAETGVYLASVAKAERITPSTVRINIPAYPGFGKQIRDRWESRLKAILGKERAEKALAENVDSFDSFFSNFGNVTQTIEATAILRRNGELTFRIKRDIIATEFSSEERPVLGASGEWQMFTSTYSPEMFEGTALSFVRFHTLGLVPQSE